MARPALPVTRTLYTRIPEPLAEIILKKAQKTGLSIGKQIAADLDKLYGAKLRRQSQRSVEA